MKRSKFQVSWINKPKNTLWNKDRIFPCRWFRLFPIIPKVVVWTWMSCSITDASTAGIQNVTLLRWERPNLPSFWKRLLFELISEPLGCALRPRSVRAEEHTVFSAYSNKSSFLMNEEVRIGSFRFSSLKGPFKCIRVCVIWSGRSRSLGVGGHDDLASFSCFSWVLMSSLCATIYPSRVRVWPAESLLSLPVGKSLGIFHQIYLQRESE